MNNSKEITVLNHLKRIMTIVRDGDLKLHMQEYYYGVKKGDTVHTCGTPACVVGYAALDPELSKELGVDDTWARGVTPFKVWIAISDISPKMGSVGGSLFKSYARERTIWGREISGLLHGVAAFFPAHLTKENPTPQDVIDYLDILIKHFRG